MDFTLVLRKEFHKRSQANPNYSLRAYARDLGVDQSALSKILSGKRRVTEKFVKKVASNMGLAATEAMKYLPSKTETKHAHYSQLEYDKFVTTADWYYDGILELIDTEHFRPDPKWIAERLNLKEAAVVEAIERLQKLNLLVITSDGDWLDVSKANSLLAEFDTTEALKNYQKQVLQNSRSAIDNYPTSLRSHTCMTFSASLDKIEEAKRILARCRRDIAALMRSSQAPRTDVFQLQLGLFPVTKKNGGAA